MAAALGKVSEQLKRGGEGETGATGRFSVHRRLAKGARAPRAGGSEISRRKMRTAGGGRLAAPNVGGRGPRTTGEKWEVGWRGPVPGPGGRGR